MIKILTFITLLFLTFSVSSEYITVKLSSTPLEAANSLAERWIIKDKSSNPSDYNLDKNVLRQEIAIVSLRVSWLDMKDSCDNTFKDLTPTTPNDWACVVAESLVDNKLITKNDFFRPEDYITKAESLKMLIKSIGYDFEYDSSSSVSWQEQYVDFAADKWVVERFTDYNTLATRGWVFMVADTTVKKYEEEKVKKSTKVYSDEY